MKRSSVESRESIMSPLEHLARSIRTDGRWEESVFVMLTPYFDCSRSGKDGSADGAIVVSGWMATVQQWERFTVDWKIVLAKYDVPYFHMKEFAHSKKAYSNGWKGEKNKRETFIRSLLEVIQDYARASFSCLIRRLVFAEVDKEYKVSEYFGSEYALCARTCVAEANKYLRARSLELPDEYVFEDGDERGCLTWLMESAGYPAPIFRPSRDKVTPVQVIRGIVPLQAADFAAYEMCLAWEKMGGEAEIWKYRKSFAAIGKIVNGEGFWGECTTNDLREMCINLKVETRP